MKIAILGTAPSSRLKAPFNDPEWTIWACSANANKDLPRVNTWFELHTVEELRSLGVQDYQQVLNPHPQVFMQQVTPEFPNCKVYPKDEVLKEFDPYWMTSSASWMLALAILQKPTHIGIWGIDMAADEEYAFQRPGARVLVEEAKKRGIEIVLPPESDLLLPPPMYGYSQSTHIGAKLDARMKELQGKHNQINNRVNQIDTERAQLMANKHYISGAIDDLNYIIRTWT